MDLYYFLPYEKDNIIYSCDMLYLKFRYNNDSFHSLLQRELLVPNDNYIVNYYESRDRFKYRHLFVVDFVKYSYKLIIKMSLNRDNVGVLEFNPNKLMADENFFPFYLKLIDNFYSLEFYKMDFATDIPVNRAYVKVLRDNRKYEKFIYGSVTEYIGSRNQANHVKIYDKKYESKLNYDLTRLEITVEAGIKIRYPDVKIMLPQMQLNLNNLTPRDNFILGLLNDVDDPFQHLRKLQKRDRQKYLDLISNQYYDFEYAMGAYTQVLYTMRDYFRFTT